ncbi:MAG: energy transducer TonB [Hyphomicrobiaceae bacterium]
MTAHHHVSHDETTSQLLARWMLAIVFVMAAHGAVALAVMHWPQPENTAGEPPAAIMIELAPVPVAPDTPPEDVAVGVRQEMSQEATPVESPDKPVEEPQPPEPVVQQEEPPPEPVEHEAEIEIKIPDLPVIADAAATLEVPAEKAAPKTQDTDEAVNDSKKAKPEKPKPRRKSVARTTSAPKRVDARRATTNAAPTSGTASSMSIATWRGTVMAHLNRYKRYPGAGGGTASVAFTINRAGHVLSARLIRSSGNSTLDREAVALTRRASPVPAPPPNIGRGSIMLTVPVRFSR